MFHIEVRPSDKLFVYVKKKCGPNTDSLMNNRTETPSNSKFNHLKLLFVHDEFLGNCLLVRIAHLQYHMILI